MSTTTKALYIAFLCAVLYFGGSTQDKLHLHVPAPVVQELRQQAQVCEKETGVPAATLKKLIEWSLTNDEASKNFLHCLCSNSGFADKDGHVSLEHMNSLQFRNGTKDDLEKTVNECNTIKLDNVYDTIYAVSECIHGHLIFTS